MVAVTPGKHRRFDNELPSAPDGMPFGSAEYLPSPVDVADPVADANAMWGPGRGGTLAYQAGDGALAPANGFPRPADPDWPPNLGGSGSWPQWDGPPGALHPDHPSAPVPRVRTQQAPERRAPGPAGPGRVPAGRPGPQAQVSPLDGSARLPQRQPGGANPGNRAPRANPAARANPQAQGYGPTQGYDPGPPAGPAQHRPGYAPAGLQLRPVPRSGLRPRPHAGQTRPHTRPVPPAGLQLRPVPRSGLRPRPAPQHRPVPPAGLRPRPAPQHRPVPRPGLRPRPVPRAGLRASPGLRLGSGLQLTPGLQHRPVPHAARQPRGTRQPCSPARRPGTGQRRSPGRTPRTGQPRSTRRRPGSREPRGTRRRPGARQPRNTRRRPRTREPRGTRQPRSPARRPGTG